MNASHIEINAHNISGRHGAPTYFIDRVDNGSHGNLRSTKDLYEARKIAREYADQGGLRVVDKTYAKQVVAMHRAAANAHYAICAAKAKAAAYGRVEGKASTFQAEIDALFGRA